MGGLFSKCEEDSDDESPRVISKQDMQSLEFQRAQQAQRDLQMQMQLLLLRSRR